MELAVLFFFPLGFVRVLGNLFHLNFVCHVFLDDIFLLAGGVLGIVVLVLYS